jgi:tetratricopeptide (TPR) repeat protein
MPRGDTDIPHVSFTHHHIGRHPLAAPKQSNRVPELIPIDDTSRLPEFERRRNLGMAYAYAAEHPPYATHAESFRRQAIETLEPLYREGLRDGEVSSVLATLLRNAAPDRAILFSREAALSLRIPPAARAPALAQVGVHEMKAGNFREAHAALARLPAVQRKSNDSLMLAELYLALDEPHQALLELKKALEFRPFRSLVHYGLAQAYTRLGEAGLAKEHLDKATWLSQRNLN